MLASGGQIDRLGFAAGRLCLLPHSERSLDLCKSDVTRQHMLAPWPVHCEEGTITPHDVEFPARCSGLQTAARGLANHVAFEPTIRANMRGREPTLFANKPTFRANSLQTAR
jgi:hypothetical protein